ncbi:hypothetical protein KCH_66550 [Kitasatospora cheerisanensis KCTC 2395]|uniref:Uncharacterized protein n=1 Tax=Kitasatospora cheerisanensis KCTC 2395 TaxID=1348663 RepID=A0A066YKD9_9ACTN|nr:hypothetical protein KCH_66550 [Kitasatospora cheerisanensis KCTC 2395]
MGVGRQQLDGAQPFGEVGGAVFAQAAQLEVAAGGDLDVAVAEGVRRVGQGEELTVRQVAPGEPESGEVPVFGGVQAERAGAGVGAASVGPDGGCREGVGCGWHGGEHTHGGDSRHRADRAARGRSGVRLRSSGPWWRSSAAGRGRFRVGGAGHTPPTADQPVRCWRAPLGVSRASLGVSAASDGTAEEVR